MGHPAAVPAQRPRVSRWIRTAALVLAGLLLAVTAAGYGYARRSLPRIGGAVRVSGLTAPVAVYRDEWGVPHLEAASRLDLYRAQGYVTAQDRLWEMDLSRRVASGRLAEIFGPSQLETDKFFRTLLLRRSGEASLPLYSRDAMALVQAYADGVNAFIAEARGTGRLPFEFILLGYQPEPWTPADTAAIGRLMAYDLGGNWPGEVYRYQLRHKVGDEMARQLFPVYPDDGPTILPDSGGGGAPAPTSAAALPPDGSQIDLAGLLQAAVVPDEFLGSNNWVVAGSRTETGKPLLANDPHLGARTPSIWYQTHLRLSGPEGQMNVIGVTFPGVPGIVIGHNEKVAWGVTNTGPDVQDLYIERRDPANPYRFLYQGQWEEATVHRESIKVKGQPDQPLEVVVTRHGPIISEVAGSPEARPNEALALRWTAHMPSAELEAFLRINQAEDWPSFREALRVFQVPTQNFVFAAVDGTIAYHAGGLVPIRSRGDGTVPVPGDTGEYEWTGFIPFDAMPEVVNPPEGMIVTANNRVADDRYPYLLATSWAQPYRAMRITEVLRSKSKLTVAEMVRLQVDYTNLQARQLLPILLPRVDRSALSETELAALALLTEWDHVDAADQGAPLLYHLWWEHLTRQLYVPQMGGDLYQRMDDWGNVTDAILRQASRGTENDWIKAAGGLDELARESFRAAVAEAVQHQGKDPRRWAWGKFHRLGPAHPIGGVVKPLGWLLNAHAYPVGGSSVTVGAMSFDQESGMVTSYAPWRQVVDLADPAGNSFDVVSPGQSGHFLSRWYSDQHGLHVEGILHPQVMSPDRYRRGTRLILEP